MFPKIDHEFIAHIDHSILRSQPGGQQACLLSHCFVCVCVCYTHTYTSCFFISLHSVHIRYSAYIHITHTCSFTYFTCTWACESGGKSQAHSSTSQQAGSFSTPAGTGEAWAESASSVAHDGRSVTGSASKTSSWGTRAAPTSIPRKPADVDPPPQGGLISSQQSLTSMSLKSASCTF